MFEFISNFVTCSFSQFMLMSIMRFTGMIFIVNYALSSLPGKFGGKARWWFWCATSTYSSTCIINHQGRYRAVKKDTILNRKEGTGS